MKEQLELIKQNALAALAAADSPAALEELRVKYLGGQNPFEKSRCNELQHNL